MKGVILAGGKGTRLSELIKNTPKPLVKIGGKPIIEHQIVLLKKYGIRDIWILLGFLGDQIRNYLLDGRNLGVRIHYYQEKIPLGTAGALKTLEHIIKEDFLVISGDVMLDFDLERFIRYHRKRRGIASIIVHPNDHPFDSDLVEFNKEGQITTLLKRPHPSDLVFRNFSIASVYIFSPNVFRYISNGVKSDTEKDILPLVLKSGCKIFAYNSPEYFKDAGTPERLFKVRHDYKCNKIHRLNLSLSRKAIFLDRDGVINREVNQLCDVKDFKMYRFAKKAIKKINEFGYLAIIVSNQPMIAKGFMTEDDLNEIQKRLETQLALVGAKIDAFYYCPHHPEKGFPGEISELKVKCKCRKPEIGLFLQAQKDFNIDLEQSYAIGDKTSDILAGQRAGCTTILVKTGYGGKDKLFNIKPDIISKNLLEAINLIGDKR